MLSMEEGLSLDAYAVNHAQRLIVCGVHGKATRLFVYKFQEREPIQVLEGTQLSLM
jgi:hypothetical protein